MSCGGQSPPEKTGRTRTKSKGPKRNITELGENERAITDTGAEAAILDVLLANEGKVVPYSLLLKTGWPETLSRSSSGRVHSSNSPAKLRHAIWRLNCALSGSYRIRAVRKRGYVLCRVDML